MSKAKKLIPVLRFPEFEKSEGWALTTIGELGSFYYGKSAPKWSLSEDAPTPCVRYGELYTKFGTVIKEIFSRTNIEPSGLRFSKGGEILIPRVGEDPYEFFKCSYLPFPSVAIGEMISVYETEEDSIFYAYYFNTLKRPFAKVVEGQNVKNLYYINLEPIAVGKPKELAEQQKIASCLSSLDELIAAHNEKLKALKDHKKGLMQNLFPQEGQKVPNYRFPEFEEDGEWVEKKLGDEDVSSFVNDKIDSQKLTLDNYISTDNMLPDYSGITKASKLPTTNRVTEFIDGDILISNIRPYLKKVWKSDRKGGASNDVLVFRSGSSVEGDFLKFILKNDAFINYVMKSAKGVKMPRGDKDAMLKYIIRIPDRKEQQKIASCLSDLDESIAAQVEKIEQLQEHKKGLMQGLFPKVSEL